MSCVLGKEVQGKAGTTLKSEGKLQGILCILMRANVERGFFEFSKIQDYTNVYYVLLLSLWNTSCRKDYTYYFFQDRKQYVVPRTELVLD